MTDNSQVNDNPIFSAHEMHLSRQQIDRVCHYTHWIPNSHGYTQRFFDKHYPGWDLSTFMKVFKAAGILVKDGSGAPLAGRCHWRLRTLHFSRSGNFAIEWDESVLDDDGKYFWSSAPDNPGNPVTPA